MNEINKKQIKNIIGLGISLYIVEQLFLIPEIQYEFLDKRSRKGHRNEILQQYEGENIEWKLNK